MRFAPILLLLALGTLPTPTNSQVITPPTPLKAPKTDPTPDVPKPAPPILPAKVSAKAGKPLMLQANVKGKLKWRLDERDVADGLFIVDGNKLTFASPYTSIYRVWVITVTEAGDPADASCDIEVKDGVPRPDGPPPEPERDDPALTLSKQIADIAKQIKAMQDDIAELKKAPRPPPVPVDAFQQALQAAYIADGKPAAKASQLASLYKLSGSIVNDKAITKEGDIRLKMHSAAQQLLADTDLANVRRVLADEFSRSIGGKTGDVLTDAVRAQIAAEFLKAQKALEKLQ